MVKMDYMTKLESIRHQEIVEVVDELTLKQPDGRIFFIKDPKQCLKQIESRARPGEEMITLSYLDEMEKIQHTWMCELKR